MHTALLEHCRNETCPLFAHPQIPRFAFEKFPGSKAELSTQMKSVGEAMAIGRTFQASPPPPSQH